MPFSAWMGRTIKHVAFGKTLLPQEFSLGMPDPQTEITVWLQGAGVRRDVTSHLSTACAEPLTLCIGVNAGSRLSEKESSSLTLVFSERDGLQRVLGQIGLEHKRTVTAAYADLHFFEPRNSKNSCLPRARMAMHYLLHAYRHQKRDNTQGIQMTFLERRASMVTFIRPHPIFLVSVGDRSNGNIFPMNLCGNLGNGYFGFALRTERVAGTVVERAGRAALCNVPEAQGYLAYRMAAHHKVENIDWAQLPFATKASKTLSIPIPEFAQRVREVVVESSFPIGSHRFFLARIIEDERFSDEPAFCSIHGFYQFWRLKEKEQRDEELARSLAGDAFHKRERHPAKP
jgi:flavin reductase (DIM6/NTAB) family NADH-FMN oxidoreductase RutF